MKSKDKIQTLREALAAVVDAIGTANTVQLKAVRAKGLTALNLTVPRASMSPEQRQLEKSQRRFASSQSRIIRHFAAVGLKAGGFAIHKVNGERVKIVTDVVATPLGFEMNVLTAEGLPGMVNALAFRPDYNAIDLGKPKPKVVRREVDAPAQRKTATN